MLCVWCDGFEFGGKLSICSLDWLAMGSFSGVGLVTWDTSCSARGCSATCDDSGWPSAISVSTSAMFELSGRIPAAPAETCSAEAVSN